MLVMKGLLRSATLTMCCIAFIATTTLVGQVSSKSFGGMFIHEGGSMSIFGSHSFEKGGNGLLPGVIATSRDNERGFLNFSEGSTWSGASDAQFVDGFVRVLHSDAFTFPIGTNGKYRPISISGGAYTSAAYYEGLPPGITIDKNGKGIRSHKTLNSEVAKNATIMNVSDQEYWEVDGESPVKLSLTWNVNSNIQNFTEGDLNSLSIIGLKDGVWEVVSSNVDKRVIDGSRFDRTFTKDESNLYIGSISTTDHIVPNDYDYFTLASVNTDNVLGNFAMDFYPNPKVLGNPLNINFRLPNTNGGTVRIYTADQILLIEQDVTGLSGELVIPKVANASGAYIVSITDDQGNSQFKNLIIVSK